jgi:hypothetical protein
MRRVLARLSARAVIVAIAISVLSVVLGRVSQTSSACAGGHQCGAESLALVLFSLGLGCVVLFGLIFLVARAEPRTRK